MEERPNERAHERRRHHGAERSPSRPKKTLKNDQSYCQYQETQTKKIGNVKINGNTTERERILSACDPISIPYLTNGNDSRQLVDTNFKLKTAGKAPAALSREESKGTCGDRSSMDGRNDKPSDFKDLEGRKELGSLLNGIVALSAGVFTNGYPGKSADHNGNGSESGCATPKKRRPQRNSRCLDNVTAAQDKAMQLGHCPPLPKQDPEPVGAEPTEKKGSLPVSASISRASSKGEPLGATPAVDGPPTAVVGETQRKNSDGKGAGALGKKAEDRSSKAKLTASVAVKEDSWTLFRPPPVFPVDNSSAKIVPKISYASKVKENLNKAAQVSGDCPPPQVSGRLSQVPMSAVKTITSTSFSNGPLSGEGNGCPLAGALFTTAASAVPPASSLLGGENVASSPDNGGGTTATSCAATGEQRKPSLFVYPLSPSNMQPTLPSGRQVDPPTPPTNQKALGDIFQNQWGLSFINEPSAGPEGAAGRLVGKGRVVEVTFQGDCSVGSALQAPPATLQGPEHQHFPTAYELDKRTSPQAHGSVLKACPSLVLAREAGVCVQPTGLEAQKGEAANLGAIVFASAKDHGDEWPQATPASPVPVVVKEPSPSRNIDRRCIWGVFDLKAAVLYHTKEMEYILNLRKQDPKRVILYDEAKEGPDQ